MPVFAVDLLRWVTGHTACGSVLLTTDSNLFCAPLAATTVSWGKRGWKEINSWTDFLSLCCLMLGGKLTNFHTYKRAGWLCWHSTIHWIGFSDTHMLMTAQLCSFVNLSGKLETGRLPVWNPHILTLLHCSALYSQQVCFTKTGIGSSKVTLFSLAR